VIVAIESHQGALHMQISTIGLDIAKNVFQVHGIDAVEKVVVRKRLRRRHVLEFFKALPPCLIGMEACATAHYWARELAKLGHEVRLMPAKDVKAYVKRNKNDAADAEAICEAVRRPTMRFVRIKSAEQQGQLMQHRTRDVLIRQRTQIINALRGQRIARDRDGRTGHAVADRCTGQRHRAGCAARGVGECHRSDRKADQDAASLERGEPAG
jgi:transposase